MEHTDWPLGTICSRAPACRMLSITLLFLVFRSAVISTCAAAPPVAFTWLSPFLFPSPPSTPNSLRQDYSPSSGSSHLMRKQKRGAELLLRVSDQDRTGRNLSNALPKPRRVVPLTQIHTVDLRQEFRSLLLP